MMSAPIMRVETPQELVHANCWVLSLPAKQMFWDLEKFCPRKWEVPAWMALRSCTMASTV